MDDAAEAEHYLELPIWECENIFGYINYHVDLSQALVQKFIFHPGNILTVRNKREELGF
jgi:hypothetical protein